MAPNGTTFAKSAPFAEPSRRYCVSTFIAGMRDNLLDGLRVLIVEDDALIALDLADTLSAAGAAVVGQANAVLSALDLIDQQVPDVAVLDWQLVGQTASTIAVRLANLAVPFQFHTSSREQPAAAHPGVPIVDKPTRPEQFVLAVAALTNKS